jgi:hypothetical protein
MRAKIASTPLEARAIWVALIVAPYRDKSQNLRGNHIQNAFACKAIFWQSSAGGARLRHSNPPAVTLFCIIIRHSIGGIYVINHEHARYKFMVTAEYPPENGRLR